MMQFVAILKGMTMTAICNKCKPASRKLKTSDVVDIMTDTTATADELAARYGIQRQTVYNICAGRKWKHITLDPQYTLRKFEPVKRKVNKKLTDEQVIEIITDKVSSPAEMAKRYNVSKYIIYSIHKRLLWKHITCDPQYTPRNFLAETKKLNVDIVTAIKNHDVTDLKSVAKEYGVSLKYLKKLRDHNYIDAWKTIPTKEYISPIKYRKKLTDDEVIGIISHVKERVKIVARKYDVHPKTVSNLRIGRLKKHITLDLNYNKWLEAKHVKTSQNQNCVA